ncbi:MAG: lysine--tRNA ligase, partial [Euryarchaeota archaeon]|nr:lysine--tRNA ligase [Euryarchaeota archaeon]
MHWADHTAQRLSEKYGSQVIASGITPSGEFHIGHLREILTAEMIHRACLDAGEKSEYIFIVDSMDPLRRVYDFLSDDYEKYIGCPLAYIPSPNPDGTPNYEGDSYATHFLNPFLDALKQIGVNPVVIMNHETYDKGLFAEKIDIAINRREEIRNVIEEISSRELPKEWYPYNPIGSDGSMDGIVITSYEKPYVYWIDRNGVSGKSDIRKAEGKMPWRVDWAAKWGVHGITCEPAGKDHGAAGGSFDTGIPICRILGSEPPGKMVYEWIQLKGSGPMSSSSGNTIGPIEALSLVPPEILRYVIARTKIKKHIDFDTGPSLFETADEYERIVSNPPKDEELNKKKKVARDTVLGALRLSQVKRGGDATLSTAGVSFRHLAMLAQIKSNDKDIWNSLERLHHTFVETNIRIGSAKRHHSFNWLSEIKQVEQDGKHRRFEIVLPEWLYTSVVNEKMILTLDPKYLGMFKIFALRNLLSKQTTSMVQHGLFLAFILWLVYSMFSDEIQSFFQ